MSVKETIVIKPLFTEKIQNLTEKERKYAFEVHKKATKHEIKKSIENRFDVKVEKVATINIQGKSKEMTIRSGGHVIRTRGRRSSWKKAIVTLKEGYSIDLLGEATG